jgi:hypothetical protein
LTVKKGKEEVDVEGFISILNKIKVGQKGNKPIGETSKKESNSFHALTIEENRWRTQKERKQQGKVPSQ